MMDDDKDHAWLGDIHPDDFFAAIDARLDDRLADSRRDSDNPKLSRNPKSAKEIMEELHIASLVSWGDMTGWPEWLRQDVAKYAATHGGLLFYERLSRALRGEIKPKWFDDMDIFILRNWREGQFLRHKTRRQAVEILHQEGFSGWFISKKGITKGVPMTLAQAMEFYASRIKRLGLSKNQGAE
jgi:hypothetical protein